MSTPGGDMTSELGTLPAAVCGSIAGGLAAAVTTPLDVAKTRIMLGEVKILYGVSFLVF